MTRFEKLNCTPHTVRFAIHANTVYRSNANTSFLHVSTSTILIACDPCITKRATKMCFLFFCSVFICISLEYRSGYRLWRRSEGTCVRRCGYCYYCRRKRRASMNTIWQPLKLMNVSFGKNPSIRPCPTLLSHRPPLSDIFFFILPLRLTTRQQLECRLLDSDGSWNCVRWFKKFKNYIYIYI